MSSDSKGRDDAPMTQPLALLFSQDLPAPSDQAPVPDWVHLLPAGTQLQTADQRGPYFMTDAAAVISATFAEMDRIPVDINHSLHLAAPLGNPSPAVGWIVEMSSRDDGIWGRVEWTSKGKALMSDRAYRGLSPVITHNEHKQVLAIQAASLVNRPNLRGLTALNSESDMSFQKEMAKKLGLAEDASADDINTALNAALKAPETALQSAVAEVGTALGMADAKEVSQVVSAAKALKETGGSANEQITALQSQISALTENGKRRDAEDFIDKAIADKAPIPSAKRDEYISMHMENPKFVEGLISDLPKLGESHTGKDIKDDTKSDAPDANAIALQIQQVQSEQRKLGNVVTASTALQMIQEKKQ
jgi:phage I-like protein